MISLSAVAIVRLGRTGVNGMAFTATRRASSAAFPSSTGIDATGPRFPSDDPQHRRQHAHLIHVPYS